MSIFSRIFGKEKRKFYIDGLGEFLYCNDGIEEYWSICKPVSNLGSRFDFGAIAGSVDGPKPEALKNFRLYAQRPDYLYSYLNEIFYSKLKKKIGEISIEDFQTDFYLKSLTCTSIEKFEFGYHSYKNDIFVELFYRSGSVTEVYIDVGCCE